MKITINEALVLEKVVRGRAEELRRLRGSLTTREDFYLTNNERKTVEPQYDIKLVDKKVVELEKFLFKTETMIKVSNAKTEIDVDFDVDKLLEPLQ